MSTDLALWQELKKGSKSALQKIYDQEFWFLYNYGLKIASNQSLVEDSIQDLFVEVWDSKERLVDTDSIRKYLLVSLRRKIVRKIKQNRKVVLEENPSEDIFDAELDIEKITVNREFAHEKSAKLKHAFDQLSSRQKEIIYLKYYSGLGYDEISETLGINNQSARNLTHRALKILKEYMLILLIFIWL